jgi:hypothetical protein
VVLNGDPEHRYVGNLNFSFAYVEGESLLMVRLHVQPLSFWSGDHVCCGSALPLPVRCVILITVVVDISGLEEHRRVVWLGLHLRLPGAQLRAARHR